MKEDLSKSDVIMAALAAPFEKVTPEGEVVSDLKWLPSHKAGKDKIECVAFISGGQVRNRLNAVMGAAWQTRIEKHEDRTICVLSLMLDGEWSDRSDVGTASNIEKQKGETTDSIKRAAKQWGVGAYVDEVPKIIMDTKRIDGKTVPCTPKGEPLHGDNLHNYINTLSIPMGKLMELWGAMSKTQQTALTKEVVKIKSHLKGGK